MEGKKGSDKEKTVDDGYPQSLSPCSEASLDRVKDVNYNEDQIQSEGDVNAVLDSQSILVLMSRRNALRGTVCEQSHFSHIMFYKNFDVPLGKFLRDNLLNQVISNLICKNFDVVLDWPYRMGIKYFLLRTL
jgi:1-phosphatidylinositol-3-phosphate 5-kinase